MLKHTVRYTVFLAILLLGYSCNSEVVEEVKKIQDLPEGTPITLKVTTAIPDEIQLSRGVDKIKNLTLLVFDQNHRYLYRRTAVLGSVSSATGTEVFLPPNTRPIIDNKRISFMVTLLATKAPRIVHFIANYDWSDFPEDYTIEGTDEGELVPKLLSQDANVFSYWQSFKFQNGFQNNTFDNSVFKLLRNKAKFTLRVQASDFTLLGFCVHNAPDKGTIAPFKSKLKLDLTDKEEMYRDVLYSFPRDPSFPTMAAGLGMKREGDVLSNKQPLTTYEYANTEAAADKQMSIIVYGRLVGKSPAYYKVDLKNEIKDENGNYLGSELFDVVRNYDYNILIKEVKSDGYATYEEAVINPAGNNIFASVELKDFPLVSDGEYSLAVDNTEAVMVLPGRFTSQIGFSGPGLSSPTTRNVRIYYRGKECKGAITGDQYVDYMNFNQELGVLFVNVVGIPTKEDAVYKFSVVGTTPTGKYIERVITLTLRRRYEFKVKLVEYNSSTNPQGERVDLKFTIPGSLAPNLFPYTVRIAADQLSPYVSAGINDGMKLVKYGKRTYYEYVVSKPGDNGLDREETLHFQRTSTDVSSVITLMSQYYIDGDIVLPSTRSLTNSSTGILKYIGLSATTSRTVPSGYRAKNLKVEINNIDQTWSINPSMVAAGYISLSNLNSQQANASLKLSLEVEEGGGTLYLSKTMSVSEWKNKFSAALPIEMNIDRVVVEGNISYRRWTSAGYTPPQVVTNGAILKVEGDYASSATVLVPAEGRYKLDIRNLSNIKVPTAFRIKWEANQSPTSQLLISRSAYLMHLINQPDLILTPSFN